jgi:uncharacterized membrane protein YhaH (DUF805 family)
MTADSQAMENIVPILSGCFLLFVALLGLALFVLNIIVFCKIYARAGYPWAMGFLMLIPIVNFIMMLILAFSEWPIQRQVKQLQQQLASSAGSRENIQNP